MRKNIFSITGILTGTIIFSMLSFSQVSASTKSVTPMNSYRYVKKTANYQVNSTSEKYKNIWAAATKKWTSKGFKWTQKSKSKTVLSTYSDSSKSGLEVAGNCKTSYRPSDGHIYSNHVLLNRAALDKYDYTTTQRIYVAEHELGHALGLAHNNKDSISVMNPSNRYYDIQTCDVKGMEKRYSTKISNDMVAGDDEVTVIQYFYVKQPTLNKVKVKYKDKKITITGEAKQIKKVRAVYNKTKKTVNVKSNKFKITLNYKNEKDIKLYGLNSKKEKITKQKKITSSKFVTAKPICNKITHTKKGITYELNTEAGSVVTAKYKGKTIKRETVDSSYTRFFIAEKTIKGKKGKLIFTQKATSKRTSKKVACDIVKKGSAMIISY